MLPKTTTRSIWIGTRMGACQKYIFHLKRKVSFKQHHSQWQWLFPLPKNIPSTLRFDRHRVAPRLGQKPGSTGGEGAKRLPYKGGASSIGITLPDVLFLEPKSFGFSTTIFSVWFLAGTKKNVFLRSSSGKAPHPLPPVPAGRAPRNMALGSTCWGVFISLRHRGRH